MRNVELLKSPKGYWMEGVRFRVIQNELDMQVFRIYVKRFLDVLCKRRRGVSRLNFQVTNAASTLSPSTEKIST